MAYQVHTEGVDWHLTYSAFCRAQHNNSVLYFKWCSLSCTTRTCIWHNRKCTTLQHGTASTHTPLLGPVGLVCRIGPALPCFTLAFATPHSKWHYTCRVTLDHQWVVIHLLGTAGIALHSMHGTASRHTPLHIV